jgi:hypothetical protein
MQCQGLFGLFLSSCCSLPSPSGDSAHGFCHTGPHDARVPPRRRAANHAQRPLPRSGLRRRIGVIVGCKRRPFGTGRGWHVLITHHGDSFITRLRDEVSLRRVGFAVGEVPRADVGLAAPKRRTLHHRMNARSRRGRAASCGGRLRRLNKASWPQDRPHCFR